MKFSIENPIYFPQPVSFPLLIFVSVSFFFLGSQLSINLSVADIFFGT